MRSISPKTRHVTPSPTWIPPRTFSAEYGKFSMSVVSIPSTSVYRDLCLVPMFPVKKITFWIYMYYDIIYIYDSWISGAATLTELSYFSFLLNKDHGQGPNSTDFGVLWKDLISWACMPNMKFLSAALQSNNQYLFFLSPLTEGWQLPR